MGPGREVVLDRVLRLPVVDEVDLTPRDGTDQLRNDEAGLLTELALRGFGEGLARLDSATCCEPPPLAVAGIGQVLALE